MRTLKEITEELYPKGCGKDNVPDDIAHEGATMSISWRMAGAIHFCLLGYCIFAKRQMEKVELNEGRRRWELWHELARGLIERICKAKKPELFTETPIDEYEIFTEGRNNEEGEKEGGAR